MSLIVAPSMLSANFGKLEEEVEMVNRSEADWFHLDIMDGVFVPNLSYGFPVVKAIAKKAKKPLCENYSIEGTDKKAEFFTKTACISSGKRTPKPEAQVGKDTYGKYCDRQDLNGKKQAWILLQDSYLENFS